MSLEKIRRLAGDAKASHGAATTALFTPTTNPSSVSRDDHERFEMLHKDSIHRCGLPPRRPLLSGSARNVDDASQRALSGSSIDNRLRIMPVLWRWNSD